MKRTKRDMTRTNIIISAAVLAAAKKNNLNVSRIAEEALADLLGMNRVETWE